MNVLDMGESLREAIGFFKKRFFILFGILYIGSLLQQALRLLFLMKIDASRYANLPAIVMGNIFLEKLTSNKYLLIFPPLWILIGIWMYATLYFALNGSPLYSSIKAGLENIHRYLGFVIVATALCLVLLFVLTLPALILMGFLSPQTFFNKTSLVFLIPIALILMLPGIVTVVSLCNGPFILLLERKGIMQSIRESFRRIYPVLLPTCVLLGGGLLIGGIAYYAMLRLIFAAKIALIPNGAPLAEHLITLFITGIPWVIAAAWFDALVYQVYTKRRSSVDLSTEHVVS